MNRKVLKVALVCGLGFGFAGALASGRAEGALVWHDDFESGNLNAWSSAVGNWAVVTSPASAHSGTKGLDIRGNTAPDTDMLSVNVSSLGFEDLTASYWFKVRDGLEIADVVSVEWTPDGNVWQELARYTEVPTADWTLATFDLPSQANENPNLQFRLRADLGGTTDRMNFDDFTIVGVATVPEPASLASLFLVLLPLTLRRKRKKEVKMSV